MAEVFEQLSFEDFGPEYQAFVDKFKPKKTTDDCYTPEAVYEAVAGWVADEYGLNRADFVRPFWPGGNYRRFDYKPENVVVDNPPFSILTQIRRWYTERGIKYFLFAPSLTLMASSTDDCAVLCGCKIIYANGADVNTSFVTSLEPELRIRSAPELFKRVKKAVETCNTARELPKYKYPPYLITGADYVWMKYVDFKVRKDEAAFTRALDSQRAVGKAVFGSGYLISERAAAERAAATVWELSPRERDIIKRLSE